MNYLLALLAFSAIMIVLATLASVLVETIHKLMGTRSSDFEEMLMQLYRNSVRPQLKNAGIKVTQSTHGFVDQVRKNPAISKNENKLLNKYFVKTAFNELTTRQFVEQFAQTDAGRELLQKLKSRENKMIADTISNLSYEFERYGQAASEYFHRRASFYSLVIAFALTITLNIDAINLFTTLSKDSSVAEDVIRSIDVEKMEKAKAVALSSATGMESRKTIEENYDSVWKSYREVSKQLDDTGLPGGHQLYPYCAGITTDPRCKAVGEAVAVKLWAPVDPALTWFRQLLAGIVMVFTSQDGWVWLFRVILTTGMIGLGAPFWYKTYRFVGQFVPGRQNQGVDSTEARQQTSSNAGVGGNQPVVVRVHDADTSLIPVSEPAPTMSTQPKKAAKQTKRANAKTKQMTPATTAAAHSADPVVTTQQSVNVKGKTGLLKDDLYNILINTPSKDHDKH